MADLVVNGRKDIWEKNDQFSFILTMMAPNDLDYKPMLQNFIKNLYK